MDLIMLSIEYLCSRESQCYQKNDEPSRKRHLKTCKSMDAWKQTASTASNDLSLSQSRLGLTRSTLPCRLWDTESSYGELRNQKSQLSTLEVLLAVSKWPSSRCIQKRVWLPQARFLSRQYGPNRYTSKGLVSKGLVTNPSISYFLGHSSLQTLSPTKIEITCLRAFRQ